MHIAILLALACAPTAQPDPKEPAGPPKPYVIFTVRTQLQREVLFPAREQFVVALHGGALFGRDGRLQAERLRPDQMRADLGGVSPLGGRDAARIDTHLAASPAPAERRLLELAMKGWAREAGLADAAYATFSADRDRWPDVLKATGGRTGAVADKEEEGGAGDGPAKAYPVRTALSRYALPGGDAACVVRLRPLAKGFDGRLDAATRKAVAAAVRKLDPSRKGTLYFAVSLEGGGDVGAEAARLVSGAGADLAKELGFTGAGYFTVSGPASR